MLAQELTGNQRREDGVMNPFNDWMTKDERAIASTVIRRYYKYLINSDTGDDVYSLAYFATWKARENYDDTKGKAYTSYQYQVVFNELYKYALSLYAKKRDRGKCSSIESLLPSFDDGRSTVTKDDNGYLAFTDDEYCFRTMMADIESAIKDEKDLFIVKELLNGKQQKDIAKELGCTGEAVRQRKNKVYEKLKREGIL